jgi:hypothetical protein
MEVHHKHHLPKNWREYLTEFFMLFAAVTLGFFAENYREHTIIGHRMEENYQALLQDLRQDSVRIKELKEHNVIERQGMITLLDALYQYQDKRSSWETVQFRIASIKKLPSYQTFFMNNTTFKNMQSSGMLSYVSNKDLRKELSYYYEVLFKKLLDNNALYDEDGRRFYNEEFPITQPSNNRTIDSLVGGPVQLSERYRTTEANRNFILNLPITKTVVLNPLTIFKVESFYLRFSVYSRLLKILEEQNHKLIEIAKAQL